MAEKNPGPDPKANRKNNPALKDVVPGSDADATPSPEPSKTPPEPKNTAGKP